MQGFERIAPALQAWVDSGKVAGVIAVVVRHGKLAFVASAGTLDPENARPVNEDAVFRIFSMTKPITTVAIMQMYERGKLRLDDPVSKYIPTFGRTRVYAGGGAQDVITRDNVSIKVNAVVYFRVVQADKAIVEVENFLFATSQLSQTRLRSILGQASLDELLAERDKINSSLQKIMDTTPSRGASRFRTLS